jgi:hypothetical protein
VIILPREAIFDELGQTPIPAEKRTIRQRCGNNPNLERERCGEHSLAICSDYCFRLFAKSELNIDGEKIAIPRKFKICGSNKIEINSVINHRLQKIAICSGLCYTIVL